MQSMRVPYVLIGLALLGGCVRERAPEPAPLSHPAEPFEPGELTDAEQLIALLDPDHIGHVAGDPEAGARLRTKLGALPPQQRPDLRALVNAYRGSELLLQARDASLFYRRGLIRRGVAALDDAVTLASDAATEQLPRIRFLRGASTRQLPSFFGRKRQAREDLAWLAARAESLASRGILPRLHLAAALLMHGEEQAAQGLGREARQSWRRAVAIGPGTVSAADARKRLIDSSED